MSAARADRRLVSSLSRCTPRTEELASWFDGRVRLVFRAYLTDLLPPLDYITSARWLVRLRSLDLPGGTVEPGETPWDAATRAVREEVRVQVAAWAVEHGSTIEQHPGREG